MKQRVTEITETLDMRWALYKQYEALGESHASQLCYEAYRAMVEYARQEGINIKRRKSGEHYAA
jgi:hypothetical protein